MRRAAAAVRGAKTPDGNLPAGIKQPLIEIAFFANFGRMNFNVGQFNFGTDEQIVDMPAEFLFGPPVTGDPLCQVPHRASGIDIVAGLEFAKTERADLD